MESYHKALLELARQSIAEAFGGAVIDKEYYLTNYPQLQNEGASFVTLTLDKALRGCIGSIIAHRSLFEDIISNAKSAAFKDPRFPPLTKEEFEKVVIEVSLLTPPKRVEFHSAEDLKQKIRPKVDGVIVKQGSLQATFLPQVWEELPTFEVFFEHLFAKAGISDPSKGIEVYTYEVEKFSEDEM